MKSYYCKRLYEEINFDAESVYVCCGNSVASSFPIYNKDNDKSLKSYLKHLLKWRKQCTKNAFLGKVDNGCINCFDLKEKNISFFEYIKTILFNTKMFKIKNIIIKSFRQCEFSCAYCLEKKYTKCRKTYNVQKSEFYDFLPILKELIKNNMLDKKELRLEFQGGSISVWNEFKEVLDTAVEYGVKSLFYHTNAVTLIPEICEAAKKIPSEMCISIDSGTKETFKKIKNEDKFETVINNIISYAKAGVKCSIKYILVKNLNDNSEELENFCKTIKYINDNLEEENKVLILLDIDFRDSLCNKDYIISDEYINLYKQVKSFCIENNIVYGCQKFIFDMLNKRKKLHNI